MAPPGRPRRRPEGERPPFAWIGGALCLDFVNTVTWAEPGVLLNERLVRGADVVEWGHAAGLLVAHGAPGAERACEAPPCNRLLRDARALRGVLHAVLEDAAHGRPPTPSTVAAFDAWVRWGFRRLRFAPPDGGGARRASPGALPAAPPTPAGSWTWTVPVIGAGRSPGPELGAAVLAPVIRSAIDLLGGSELARLRGCANPRCGWLFVDRSRKHNRRWCDMRECGNRAKARRYYRRRRAAGGDVKLASASPRRIWVAV